MYIAMLDGIMINEEDKSEYMLQLLDDILGKGIGNCYKLYGED